MTTLCILHGHMQGLSIIKSQILLFFPCFITNFVYSILPLAMFHDTVLHIDKCDSFHFAAV